MRRLERRRLLGAFDFTLENLSADQIDAQKAAPIEEWPDASEASVAEQEEMDLEDADFSPCNWLTDGESVAGNSFGAASKATLTDSATAANDIDAVRERVLKSDWRKKVGSCKTNPAVAEALAAITPEQYVETAKARTRDLLTAMLLHTGVNKCDLVVLLDDAWFNSDALLEALLNNMGGLRFGVLVASDKKRGGGDINDITRGLSSTTSTIAITTAVNVAAAALNTRLLVLEEALTSREYPEDDKRFFNKKTNPVPVRKDERDFCIVFIYSALFAACNARGNEIVLGHHMLDRDYKVILRLESMALPEAVFAALKNVMTVENGTKVAVFSGSPHFGGAGVRDGFEKAGCPLQAVCKCAEAACVNADKAGVKDELLSKLKLAAAAVHAAVVAAALCPRRDILLGLFGADAVLLCAKKGSSHEVGEAVLASVAALRGKSLSEELASGDGGGYVTAVEAAAQSANSGNTTFELPSLVVTDSDGIIRSILNKAVAVENLLALLEIVDGLVAGLDRTKFEVNPNVTANMQLRRYCAEQASKEPKEREKPQPDGVVYLATESKTENGKKVLTAIYANIIAVLKKRRICRNVQVSTFTICLSHDEAVENGNRSTVMGGVKLGAYLDLDDVLEELRATFESRGVDFQVDCGKRVISVLDCGETPAVELKDAMSKYGKFRSRIKDARDAAKFKHAADVDSQRAANGVLDLEKRKSAEAADGEKMRRVKSTSISAADLAAHAAATTAVAAQKTKRRDVALSKPPAKRRTLSSSKWTKEEDMALLEAVQMTQKNKFNEIKWNEIAATLQSGRKPCACKMRWTNFVDPKICKGTWRDAEYAILVKAHVSLSKRESLA
ncbi:hypothetical protein M885DRAFT_603546 [Pelagophyceae sp. CCMP2097]|nr:hypothetical protein M885DRAFT_603546 [Pelagophyceae sp. CCMP2097]